MTNHNIPRLFNDHFYLPVFFPFFLSLGEPCSIYPIGGLIRSDCSLIKYKFAKSAQSLEHCVEE